MKEKQQAETDKGRRQFLRAGAAAGVGAVATVSLPAQASAGPEEAPEQEPKGYRLTDHILAYYRSAAD